MKNIIKTGATCALIFLTGATAAQARGGHQHDEALAAIGGFIGGVIVSEALHDHDRGQSKQVYYEQRGDRGKDRDRGKGHGHGNYDRGHGQGHNAGHGHAKVSCECSSGYWRDVQRRVFVPASFAWRVDSCGQRYRVTVPARFNFVRERIWVNGHRPTCRVR